MDNFFKKIMSPGFLLKLKIGLAVSGIAVVLILLLVVVSALISPLQAGWEIFQEGGEIVEKLGNFFTLRGWKLNEEIEIQEERKFYEKLDEVKTYYFKEYSVGIDTNILESTLFYNLNVKDYFEDNSESIRCEGYIGGGGCYAEPVSYHDFDTAIKQIQTLAAFQVTTNVYHFQGCVSPGQERIEIWPDLMDARAVANNDKAPEDSSWWKKLLQPFLDFETNYREYDIWPSVESYPEICIPYLGIGSDDPRYAHYYSIVPPEKGDIIDVIYKTEVDEGGVYYWNLIDEVYKNTGGSFLEVWYDDFLKSTKIVDKEERLKELAFNIYEYARVTAGSNAYKGGGSTSVGEESFGSVDFVSRNESIEGLDDSFYTTMSNPFYASGINNSYNPYQCTTYVYGRVSEVLAESGKFGSLKVSGNAGDWLNNNYAYPSSTNIGDAKKGAIAVFRGRTEGYGHVVFIENVNPDGTIDFSEGNVRNTGNKYGYRYTSGVDPTSSGFRNLYGLEFQGFIFPFD